MSARFGYKLFYPKERARLIGYAYFSSFPPFFESRSPFLLLYPIFFSDTCRIHHIGTGIGIYPMYPKSTSHFGYDFTLLIIEMSHCSKVICRLETYIGNIVDWKHQNRLETKFLDGKHDDEIENKKSTLETMNLDWKQNS